MSLIASIDYSKKENEYSNYYDNHEETADSSKEKVIIDDTETLLVKNAIYYLTQNFSNWSYKK